jgi:hypothetical protein
VSPADEKEEAMKKLTIFTALCTVLVIAGLANAQMGSLLVFPLIDNLSGRSTIIQIANQGDVDVLLDCMMVTHDAAGPPSPPALFSMEYRQIPLTTKEVYWWDTGDSFDNRKGFSFCWAINNSFDQQEIDHDFLTGGAIVFGGGLSFHYNAIAHQAITVDGNRVLMLDGNEYSMGTSTVMFEGFVDRFSGINGFLTVASLEIGFEDSIQPTVEIDFACKNENGEDFPKTKVFSQFAQYDYGADLDLIFGNVSTPKFHCVASTTTPLWAVAYEWTGGLAWGTNVFQDPNSATPVAVELNSFNHQ